MVLQGWYFDAIIYIYALSLLFTLSDFVERNQRARQLGAGLLAFVWLLQTAALAERLLASGSMYMPLTDALPLLSWVVITASLALYLWLKLDMLLFVVNVAGFIVTAASLAGGARSTLPLGAEDGGELLVVQVTLAMSGYAALLFSAIFSGVLMFVHSRLKRKLWSESMKRLPSLDRIHVYALRLAVAGVCLQLLALALGGAGLMAGRSWGLSSVGKMVAMALAMPMYASYFLLRLSGRTTWSRQAAVNLCGFALAVVGFALAVVHF